jgi:p-hydroxybenzoate 3-monooxygenase
VVERAENVRPHDVISTAPSVSYSVDGVEYHLACDFIAGCDGFHGVSRRSISGEVLRTFERSYPFGWLGIMSETKPIDDIVYAHHERGFALASQRSPKLARYYIQCPTDTNLPA